MSKRRAAAWILLALVLLFTASTAILWTQRRALARRAIVDWLEARGVAVASLDVHRLSSDRLVLRDIGLRTAGAMPAEMRIARLALAGSPFQLAQRRLETLQIEIDEARVRAEGADGSVEIALHGRADGVAPDRLGLDLSLNVVHPSGRGETQLRSTLRLDPDTRGLALALESAPVSGSWGGEGEALRFGGKVPELQLRARWVAGDDRPELHFEGDGGRFFVPLYEFEADRIALTGVLGSASRPDRIDVRVGSILNRARPDDYPPLVLEADVLPLDDGLDFALELFDPKRMLVLKGSGSHALAGERGALRITSNALRFEPGGARLEDLAPALAESFREVRGTLSGEGRFSWEQGEVSGNARVEIEGMGFESDWADVSGIDSRLELAGPFPFHTTSLQRIDVGRLAAGLELSPGIFELQLREDGKLELDRMQWGFADGTLGTRGVWDPLDESNAFDLRASALDLGALLAMVELDGLSGSGRVAGVLPLRWDGRSLVVRDGVLESSAEGGWIRYRPDASASAVARESSGFALATDVLENFHYERVSLTMNGDLLGDVQLVMKLAGANPDYQGGAPIEFNLNVEASLGDLVRGGSTFYGLQKAIERKLDAQRKGP